MEQGRIVVVLLASYTVVSQKKLVKGSGLHKCVRPRNFFMSNFAIRADIHHYKNDFYRRLKLHLQVWLLEWVTRESWAHLLCTCFSLSFFSFPFILLLCFSSPFNYYFIIFHFNYLCLYFIFILNFSFSYSYVLRDICIYFS